MSPGRRTRPQVVLHSTLEAVVAGAVCGAVYAVLMLASQFVLVGGANEPLGLSEIPGALAWLMLPAIIGGVIGAAVGLVCGLVAGLALALTDPHASTVTLRGVAAVGAAAPLWVVGGLAYLDDPTLSTLLGVALLTLAPSAVAAIVAAVRAPALVGSGRLWAAAEQRRAAVERLGQ